MKRIFPFLVLFLFLPAFALAAGRAIDRPHWSLEVKGGRFQPSLDNFAQYYGKDHVDAYGASLAYKITRQVEAGVSANRAEAKGSAFAQLHNAASGAVAYELRPVSLFVLGRGIWSEEQWIVPYAGGGFTRVYYRQAIEGQETVRGSADGYHVRAGLQFALDGLDPGAATHMYLDYGILHTSLFIEAEYCRAKTGSPSVDIGGTSYAVGLLFEF